MLFLLITRSSWGEENDRLQWALAIVERSIETLRQHAAIIGDSSRFELPKSWLATAASQDETPEAASTLGTTRGAFNVAIHRLRKRFRQVVKSHIAETVDDPAEIADELNYLICA